MQIFLSPSAEKPTELREVYNRALDEAQELYIATAYLMEWDVGYKLNGGCKRLVFLVGTDFGLTRKAALLHVLRWIPRRIPFSSPSNDSMRRTVLTATPAFLAKSVCSQPARARAAFSCRPVINAIADVWLQALGWRAHIGFENGVCALLSSTAPMPRLMWQDDCFYQSAASALLVLKQQAGSLKKAERSLAVSVPGGKPRGPRHRHGGSGSASE
jgi:hypothetical protein